jgi:hypothetical protein
MSNEFIQKGTWFILSNGLDFDKEEIEFLPYLKIRKVKKISVFDLASLGAKGFSQWALIEPFCYNKNKFEIISQENDSTSGYDILNRAWLLNTLLVLRSKPAINSIALLNRSWSDIKNIGEKDIVQTNLCDYHVRMLRISGFNQSMITYEDTNWIRRYFETVNNLANKNDKFRYALEVLNSWRYCVDAKSAIAIIWAAIESIIDVSSEIVYRLSLSISALLCERGDQRISKFNEVKSLYNLRSKTIHGSNLKEAEIATALLGSFKLLSELVIYMTENNNIIKEEHLTDAIFR